MTTLTASPDFSSGHADRADFQHARQHRDHVLDLVRIHVEAGHQDHVLLAIDDVEETLLVHLRHVAGVQPALGVDDVAVSSGRCQ
jgi:hypothetical protein